LNRIIKNCPKCNRPLNQGNIKREPFGSGKRTHAVHKKCPETVSSKPAIASSVSHIASSVSLSAPVAKQTSVSKVQTSVTYRPGGIVNSPAHSRPYRFFLDPVSIFKVNQVAASGGQTVTLTARIVEPSLPDRDPEAFMFLTEIKIGE